MAYIYPYAGHNSNTVTTNNGDNQPITPTHQNLVVRSDKAYPFKSLQSILSSLQSHCRAFAAMALLLLASVPAFAQVGTNQNINWTNTTKSRYWNMCGDSGNPMPTQTCDACSYYYTISDASGAYGTDATGWLTFKAPATCKLKVTLSSTYHFGYRGNGDRDHLYVSENTTGSTQNNTGSASRDWYYDDVSDREFTTTNAGAYVTIYFNNGASSSGGGGNDSRYSTFTITVECFDCLDCDESFNMSNGLSKTINCGTTYCFYDDGGPNNNYDNTNGDQTATFTSNGDITLTFISFSSRNNDKISVYDGGTGGTQLINQHSGNNSLPPNNPVTATSGTMTVVWHNAADNTRSGWVAIITADCSTTWSTGTTTTLTCGETLTVTKSSSNVDAEGGMTFTLPQASIAAGCHIKVTLKSDNLNLTARQGYGGNRYDNLSVYNGTTNTPANIIGTAWQSTLNNGTVTQPNVTGDNGIRTSANGQSSVHVYFTNGNNGGGGGGGGGGGEAADRRSSFTFTVECVDCGSTPSCTTDPAFDNCPDELESGNTWNPHWNTSATPTGWTSSNNDRAYYNNGTVTGGGQLGQVTISANAAASGIYCEGTMTCTFNVVCNTSKTLSLSSTSGTVAVGGDVTATITNTTGRNITWTPNNIHATATQTGNTLTIQGVSEGTTVITGTIDEYNSGGVTYCAKEVTYEVTVTAGSTSCDGTETTVGNGYDLFATYGPVYNLWEYGYRQIIYNPVDDDICGGTISKIAFNYYDGTSFTRNPVTIYMGETTKEAFQSITDWITDLSGFTTVYQGSLSFTTTGWQWINLQNTFNYSGQDNLVVIIKDDNGSYGYSHYFYTHTTTGNRQIYAYRGNNAYNTANPGNANNVTNYRPDTKFCIDCGGGCPRPTNLTVSDVTNTTAHVEWDGTANNYNIRYRRLGLSEGFESGIPATWTTIDADGDGFNWNYSLDPNSYYTHSGNGIAYSKSWDSDNGALNPDNWLITPQVDLFGTVSFWYRGQDPDYPDEKFQVYLSTAGTAVGDFTAISGEFTAIGSYQRCTVDLSSYSGQGYIAIRHFNVTDMFILNIDDFEIWEAWTNSTTSQNNIDLTGLAPGTTYEVQVQADCDGALSPWTPSEIFTTCNLNATIEFGD